MKMHTKNGPHFPYLYSIYNGNFSIRYNGADINTSVYVKLKIRFIEEEKSINPLFKECATCATCATRIRTSVLIFFFLLFTLQFYLFFMAHMAHSMKSYYITICFSYSRKLLIRYGFMRHECAMSAPWAFLWRIKYAKCLQKPKENIENQKKTLYHTSKRICFDFVWRFVFSYFLISSLKIFVFSCFLLFFKPATAV